MRADVRDDIAAGERALVAGRYAEAESVLRAAVERARSEGDRLDLSDALNELAVTFKYSGRFDEAEVLYREALAIVEAELGPHDSDVATIYHNLGGLRHARGDFIDAERYARRSVEIREAVADEQENLAADRAALASILDALGRHDEAETLLLEVLATFERIHGPDDYEVAINLNNLAVIYQRRGELGPAEEMYRRALQIKETELGAGHPELATTLNNLAVTCRSLGRHEEAEQCYRKAVTILEKSVEPNHPNLATMRQNYAALLVELGRDAEAAGDRCCSPTTGRIGPPTRGDDMAKKSGKRSGADAKKLAATVEKLRARVKKAEAATDKWRAEAKSLRAEVAKRAKQAKKLKKAPTSPRGDAPEETSAARPVPDESWTVLRLRAAAREAGVVGYSRMTKVDLLKALSKV